MAKMVDIEALKPILSGILNEENEAGTIEGIMAIAQDYDEEAINGRINEAVEAAKAEAAKEYSAKLHDMFFGGGNENKDTEVVENDSDTDAADIEGKATVEDIFE